MVTHYLTLNVQNEIPKLGLTSHIIVIGWFFFKIKTNLFKCSLFFLDQDTGHRTVHFGSALECYATCFAYSKCWVADYEKQSKTCKLSAGRKHRIYTWIDLVGDFKRFFPVPEVQGKLQKKSWYNTWVNVIVGIWFSKTTIVKEKYLCDFFL